jgi:hypothetical protein
LCSYAIRCEVLEPGGSLALRAVLAVGVADSRVRIADAGGGFQVLVGKKGFVRYAVRDSVRDSVKHIRT